MQRKLIVDAIPHKYFKAMIPIAQYQNENTNFSKLLFFIGSYRRQGVKNEIGSAYVVIRKKTDELLGLSKVHGTIKTSKSEVKSVRFYYSRCRIVGNDDDERFVKIPFKIAYIFMAIDLIVREICSSGIRVPDDLKEFVNQTYLTSFYSVHTAAYDDCKATIPVNWVAQRALDDDFHGPFSPLYNHFL